jgi:hypothetical protein
MKLFAATRSKRKFNNPVSFDEKRHMRGCGSWVPSGSSANRELSGFHDGMSPLKSASVRNSSTDEMGVCQELADWCFRPYHGIGPPRGAAAPFYGKVNYGKIKTLYAVLQPAGSRKREGVVQ